MSTIEVNKITPVDGGTATTLGDSGDTFTAPTGVGLTVTDEVKTNKISPASGTTFTLGDSGDTFNIPAGATIANAGTATGFGGNTPSFYAYKSGNTAVANATETLLTPTTEVFDSDSTYDTSNGRFTPGVAGKYFIGCSWRMDSAYADRAFARIRKNGSGDGAIKFQEYEMNPGTSGSFAGGHTTAIVTSNTTDYFQVYAYHNRGQQENVFDAVFYAFKIAGV